MFPGNGGLFEMFHEPADGWTANEDADDEERGDQDDDFDDIQGLDCSVLELGRKGEDDESEDLEEELESPELFYYGDMKGWW